MISLSIGTFSSTKFCKDAFRNLIAVSTFCSFIRISITPPYMSLTIGALSRRFKTIPILLRFGFSGLSSYNIPIYRFFESRQNGMSVFSYTHACGDFKNLVARLPTSFANSIVISRASFPRIGIPSDVARLNVKNTESVLCTIILPIPAAKW